MPRPAKGSDCGCDPKSATQMAHSASALSGSFEMDRAKSARAALHKIAQAQSGRSAPTSPTSTSPTGAADVTPLKS